MEKNKLARNTTYFTAALMLQKVLAFIYFWFISNNLTTHELGQYVFALSFAALFSIIVDIGLSPVLTREAAKNPDKANDLLQNVLGLKLPLSILALITAWIFITLTAPSPEVIILVYASTIVMLLDSFALSFWVIMRSRHNLKYESIATIFVQLIIFTIGVATLYTTREILHLIFALIVAGLFNCLFVISLLKFKLKFSLKPKYNHEMIKALLKIVPAFALAGVFIKIYNAADSVLLGYLDSELAVGYFAVPAKLVTALQQIIPAAFAAAIFPLFSSYYAESKEMLAKTFEKSFTYLTVVGIPLALGLVAVGPEVIAVVWPEFNAVVPTLFAMSLAIPFIFLAFPTGYLLNACDMQKHNTINRGIVMTIAITLNIILIPRLSFFGAGITYLTTNIILLGLDMWWVRKVIKINSKYLATTVSKTLLAGLAMFGVLYLAKDILINVEQYQRLILLVLIGALIYSTVIIWTKVVSWREIFTMIKKQS
jgi:O-antigen/teichoic acid export membrane protein